MSVEYVASFEVPLSAENRAAVLRLISSYSACSVVGATANSLKLRFNDIPERESWPEDVEADVQERRILVVFYSGTADHRDRFLKYLGLECARIGIDASFIEE